MKIIKSCSIFCLLLVLTIQVSAGNKYYRYKDTDGNLVITSTMHPDKAKLGYDIIDANGKVLGKVEPELTGKDLNALKQEQQAAIDKKHKDEEQKEYDLSLIRKYSFVTDIEAEKKRKLIELQATLSIVKGNLNSVRSELEVEYARAAVIERQGKPIPEDIKKRIKDVEAVVISTEDLYKMRQKELKTSSDEYDHAIKRFKELEALRGKK